MQHLSVTVALALALFWSGPSARAGFVDQYDYDSWTAAAGPHFTIGFSEFPPDTKVTNQFASEGVLFVDLDNFSQGVSYLVFPRDGYGLDGQHSIELKFTKPAIGIASHFPGGCHFDLYLGQTLLYESTYFGITGLDNFGGVSGDVLFDQVILHDGSGSDQIFLDDLHIAFAPVPGPGAVIIVVSGLCLARGRRRRR